jgi:hypothetical protein
MNALQASKAYDITGVVAIACARHGCYAPNALADLSRESNRKMSTLPSLKHWQRLM